MSETAALKHAYAVHATLSELAARFPNMPLTLDTFLAVSPKRARAHLDGPRPWLSAKAIMWDDAAWRDVLRWERKNKMRHTTERRRTQVADNVRHEYGHVLSTPKVMSEWGQVYSGLGREWFRKRVSDYAATDGEEGLAEVFALCTRPRYRRGRLPSEVEDFIFKTMLGEGG